MKLNTTYPLKSFLESIYAASESPKDIIREMLKTREHHRDFVEFEPEGMLTTSPCARVTMKRQVGESRWEGVMETTAFSDGPVDSVAVNRRDYVMITDSQFKTFIMYARDANAHLEEEMRFTLK